jgi:IPT/TIG domain
MRLKEWKAIFVLSFIFFVVCASQALAAAPTLVSLSPESGTIGSSVVITGSNFGSSQERSTVQFNGTAAEVKSWSNARILVTVPSGATTGEVVVIVSGVGSNGKNFKIVSAPNGSAVSPPLQTDRHSLLAVGFEPCEEEEELNECAWGIGSKPFFSCSHFFSFVSAKP